MFTCGDRHEGMYKDDKRQGHGIYVNTNLTTHLTNNQTQPNSQNLSLVNDIFLLFSYFIEVKSWCL